MNQQESVLHYRAYRPRPFTREERDRVTILFGGLHWRAERVLQGAIENCGYKAQVLPVATKQDLLAGRETADIGQCCPTSFTTGNLANFLRAQAKVKGAKAVEDDYIYVTAGSCGSCRFGQYHQSYELSLKNIGMESFRMFLLSQDVSDQGAKEGGGLDINLPFTMGAVWAMLVSDVVQDLEYRTRPYEVKPGQTAEVAKESVEYLYRIFRDRPVRTGKWGMALWHLGTSYFVNAMREVRRRFDQVEVDRLRVKPLVKITGEFYLQTVEGEPNYNIHQWLESEGAEVYPAAIMVWLDYLLRMAAQHQEDRTGVQRHAGFKARALRSGQRVLRWNYDRMRAALGNVPRELPDQYELRDLAAPYFHSRLDGGEGDMLIGKALWAYKHKKAHMTCELSPYSCMPNTMSIGAMSAVLGKYPDLLYAPLEIKGDAEVHALSRCQMILTEAKKQAQLEYERALEVTGLTTERARELLESSPQLKRATFPVPRHGVAGTAANTIMHLASEHAR
jgi:predicted nucleotide-binding protein (sugar kinase/HSP70/actin superfamily)